MNTLPSTRMATLLNETPWGSRMSSVSRPPVTQRLADGTMNTEAGRTDAAVLDTPLALALAGTATIAITAITMSAPRISAGLHAVELRRPGNCVSRGVRTRG